VRDSPRAAALHRSQLSRRLKSKWQRGQQRFPKGADPDGTRALLSQLTGDAKRFVAFAKFMFDRELPLALREASAPGRATRRTAD
jgi:hypothetical protein